MNAGLVEWFVKNKICPGGEIGKVTTVHYRLKVVWLRQKVCRDKVC
jgi:uncharacterized protein (DUF3820 family)